MRKRKLVGGMLKSLLMSLFLMLVLSTLYFIPDKVEATNGQIDNTWTIVVGTEPLEQTAGEDLKAYLSSEFGVTVNGPVVASSYTGATHGIFIGTTSDNTYIGNENSRLAFNLNSSSSESYHFVNRINGTSENLWIVGQTAKGAMNGTFRFEDRKTNHVSGLDETGTPAFKNRMGGHLMTQSAPSTWTEDQQAAYYAKNYINVVWGEKHGPPLSYAARQKYGLGLALEVKLPPVTDEWKNDPANESAVYYRDTWSGQRKVLSPYDSVGRQAYLDAFKQAIADNPDTKILYSLFGDYSFTTDHTSTRVSDGLVCKDNDGNTCTSEGSIKEVMSIMKEAIGARDIIPAVWMWHLYPSGGDEAFMDELKSLGYGMIYNEASNSDDWMYKRDNYNSLALKTDASGKTKFGDKYMVLVSAGSAGESVDPAIGVPLPHVAAYKIRKLADAKIDNFLLWWGSSEGWAYSANMAAIKEMIWDPNVFDPTNTDPFNSASPEPLMNRIATRDFGSAIAPDILDFWKSFDSAVVSQDMFLNPSGIKIFSWNQRLGCFTLPDVFGGGYPEPLIPGVLSNKDRFKLYYDWGMQQEVIDNFGAAVANMDAALTKAWNLRMSIGDSSPELKEMHLWGALFKRVFESQYNMLQGLQIIEKYRAADGTVDIHSSALRTELAPVTQSEIDNTNATVDLISQFAPNFNLSGSHIDAVKNNGNRDKEIEMLKAKAASMNIWLDDLKNLAIKQPVTASSEVATDRKAIYAVDGDISTLWHSNYNDNEWIYVDLGAEKTVKYVKVAWNKSANAKEYKIQLSSDLTGGWVTAKHVTLSTGKTDVLTLADNTSARYVKMQGVLRNSIYGYAINEYELYGDEKNSSSNLFEAESLTATTSGDSRTQFSDINMSGDMGDKLSADAVGDYITYDVNLTKSGTYKVLVGAKKQDSRGIFQLSIDGLSQGSAQDNYSSSVSYVEFDLGDKTFDTSGAKQFKLTVTGKNANSLGYTLGLDYIKLVPVGSTSLHEAESLVAVTSGDSRTQFSDTNMSGGMGDKLSSNAVGDYITYDADVSAAGTYTIYVGAKKHESRGIFQLSIGGVNQGMEQDNYSSTNSYVEFNLGDKTFSAAGTKNFKFNITGKNANSTDYTLGLDYIKLVPVQ